MTELRVSGFKYVPPVIQGHVRDLRVRWALEEAGRPYKARLIDFQEKNTPEYRALQPFGQVPALEEGDLKLFESGAIVLHVAEGCPALMPSSPESQTKVKMWVFAALNTVEPPLGMLSWIDFQPGERGAGVKELRDDLVKWVDMRLDNLVTILGDQEYLVDNRFTAADLLMSAVLRILKDTDFVTRRPTLNAYQQRCEARPAFKKALQDQLDGYEAHAPKKAEH